MSTLVFSSLKSWDGKVSEAEFNKLVDALQSITLGSGLGYKVLRTAAGTTIQPEGRSAGAFSCPFSVALNAVAGDPASLKVSVSPGTVNQYVATNVFDTFTISTSGTYYVKAGVETDGQDVTSFTIYVDTSEPDAQTATASSLPSSFDVLIAIIKNGKAYRVLSCGSIILNGHEEFRTDKDSPAGPGELTYIPYYVWQVSIV